MLTTASKFLGKVGLKADADLVSALSGKKRPRRRSTKKRITKAQKESFLQGLKAGKRQGLKQGRSRGFSQGLRVRSVSYSNRGRRS
ncbi:MAG: hypothetical protein RBT61_13380 [Candidatus Kapabacteria bacterium]|jgi:flagellar biosynthesis/type III secretory pathway protein FliH|nr:hypothetical protein [Candidatus Kapabacteria bacterium]